MTVAHLRSRWRILERHGFDVTSTLKAPDERSWRFCPSADPRTQRVAAYLQQSTARSGSGPRALAGSIRIRAYLLPESRHPISIGRSADRQKGNAPRAAALDPDEVDLECE